MATVDFKSSAGAGMLHDMTALQDAQMLIDVKAANGIIFGKTNVPEFASSIITCNYASGCTQSPFGRLMSAGGSSGGSLPPCWSSKFSRWHRPAAAQCSYASTPCAQCFYVSTPCTRCVQCALAVH